jgi:putative membrane protein
VIDYDPHDWRSHLLDIKGSVVRQILGREVFFTAWSVLVYFFHSHVHAVGIDAVGHTLIGVVLGLLLVFRTNQSYDRFWEGRKLWGAITNTTRNLGRAAAGAMSADPKAAAEVIRWTAAFPFAAMNLLRRESGLGSAEGLPPAEVTAVMASNHPPLAVARKITALLADAQRRGVIPDIIRTMLEAHVTTLIDCIGACERIRNTPLPFAYVVHMRRCLLVYCATLPMALVDKFGPLMVPATMLLNYMLLGIEEIGVEVENPFGRDDNDLPLERFCDGIAGNLREITAELGSSE